MTTRIPKLTVLTVDPDNLEDTILDAVMQMMEAAPGLETGSVLLIARSFLATVIVDTCEGYEHSPERLAAIRKYMTHIGESCLRWAEGDTLQAIADQIRHDCVVSAFERAKAKVVG